MAPLATPSSLMSGIAEQCSLTGRVPCLVQIENVNLEGYRFDDLHKLVQSKGFVLKAATPSPSVAADGAAASVNSAALPQASGAQAASGQLKGPLGQLKDAVAHLGARQAEPQGAASAAGAAGSQEPAGQQGEQPRPYALLGARRVVSCTLQGTARWAMSCLRRMF